MLSRAAGAMAVLLAVAAVPAARAEAARLEFLGLSGPIPEQWVREAPGSAMRLAQFRLPGDEEAQLIVYYFGPGQGGSTERNVARWRSQFSRPDGGPVEPRVAVIREAGPRITLVELNGTYRRGIGAASTAVARPDQTLLVAIVETQQGNAFLQLFGPMRGVRAHAGAFRSFLEALGPA